MISEKSSDICGQIWDPADRITTARLAYVETAAALAAAERLGRLTVGQRAASREILDELWGAVDVIELDARLMLSAADVAARRGLRGYDAVHCAAAAGLRGEDVVAAAGDQQLLAAWSAEGLAVIDTNAA